ncbi:MAG: uroporphyrinogen decarboxylase family protein [Candidatus Omnitrophica bacterium]|nr:uroporphyrinogen decarboxylase family protein [Candidatus Omnitrophota bacterium]
MGNRYHFGLGEYLILELTGISFYQLHFDAKAIVKGYESLKPLAERLGIEPPVPRMAGFAYPHIAALGADVIFPEDGEPKPVPFIKTPEDIDNLKEPNDYLKTPLIQKKLSVWEELKSLCPETPKSIGHLFEGSITTAVLLMGESFLTLPYDDPKRAHKLLTFCTESALHYAQVIISYFGEEISPGPKGIPDDFAGMFSPSMFNEFVLPYWDRLYKGLKTTERHLHSELLRKEHLPSLKKLDIKVFDPSADQYLTPEILKDYCPCDFTLRIKSWEIDNLSADELVEYYKKLQGYSPLSVNFYMSFLRQEEKIKRLLDVARKMEEKDEK